MTEAPFSILFLSFPLLFLRLYFPPNMLSPSGVSLASKRLSFHTPGIQPSYSRVSPVAKRQTLHPLRVTPNVSSPQRSRATLGLRDSGDRPTAVHSLALVVLQVPCKNCVKSMYMLTLTMTQMKISR